MSIDKDLNDAELILFEEIFGEIFIVELKISTFYTATLYGSNTNQKLRQEFGKDIGKIEKARNSMQVFLGK